MNKCLVVKLLPATDRNCFLDLTVVSMVLTAEIKELQQAVKEDYDNRELIDKLTLSLRQMTEFINKFDLQSRFLLAKIDERLCALERKMNSFEARVVTVAQP
ncbi:hypothetical protein MP638_004499 [Amoeboaphelidium occidentale]|nr:hypothetical protein MP638_004499 [Amoeboaphelidium occidentale]